MDENSTISVGDAYRAMFEFVDRYWHEGLKAEEQIGDMLSSMNFNDRLGPTKTMDPASWQDWLAAVEKVTK